MKNNGQMALPSMATPKNGAALKSNDEKTGRTPNPLSLNNIGKNKCILNPISKRHVTASRYYALRKNDIFLNDLRVNSFIDHPDFNGTMEIDEWMDETMLRINGEMPLEAIPEIGEMEFKEIQDNMKKTDPDLNGSLIGVGKHTKLEADKYDPDGAHSKLINENYRLKNQIDEQIDLISELRSEEEDLKAELGLVKSHLRKISKSATKALGLTEDYVSLNELPF